MRRIKNIALAILPAFLIVLFWSSVAVATPEMGEKEKKECIVCHVSDESPELNEVGKYYEKNKKLPPAKKK